MENSGLGKIFPDGSVIVRQGEAGDCMYVIQEGEVEVVKEREGREVHLATLKVGDFFGEVPLFERQSRSATVRALGTARLLTVDKRTLLGRIHEDPSLAYRILETLSRRVRQLDAEVTRLMLGLEGRGESDATGGVSPPASP